MCPIPLSPQTLENTAIYTVFFNFSMFQCRWPTQTYIQKILQKHCLFTVFLQWFLSLHIFRHKVGPKLVFAVFSMLWHPKTIQNIAIYSVFFIFARFSIAGSLPKWPKIPFQYPLKLRHPKIVEKSRKHHLILVSVKTVFAPPPSAKADIATAILTNVIEHLVWLFAPQ